MDVNECHRTLFGQTMFSVCKSAFSFLMFNRCTSWTNLPYGYNDCPTAGVSEPSSFWTFSFGSYHIKNVTPYKWYFGSWNFSGGYLLSSTFYLNGQENSHQFCWWDSIWCMGGTRSQRLNSGTLNWGSTLYRSW